MCVEILPAWKDSDVYASRKGMKNNSIKNTFEHFVVEILVSRLPQNLVAFEVHNNILHCFHSRTAINAIQLEQA